MNDQQLAGRQRLAARQPTSPRNDDVCGLYRVGEQWHAKYEIWIPDHPTHALVYLADEQTHGLGFPQGIDELVGQKVNMKDEAKIGRLLHQTGQSNIDVQDAAADWRLKAAGANGAAFLRAVEDVILICQYHVK